MKEVLSLIGAIIGIYCFAWLIVEGCYWLYKKFRGY